MRRWMLGTMFVLATIAYVLPWFGLGSDVSATKVIAFLTLALVMGLEVKS